MKKTLSMALALVMLVATLSATLVFAASAADETPITPDTSWYSADGDNFEIANAADFLGFVDLLTGKGATVQPVTFKDKTIKVTDDIDLNPGWSALNYFNNYRGAVDLEPTPVNQLKGYVGSNSQTGTPTAFLGTFDGQNHTISGLYWFEAARDMGIFGAALDGISEADQTTTTVIKNVAFVNSYVEMIDQRQAVIIGKVNNNTTIENVYNGMYIRSHQSAQAEGNSAFAGYVGSYDGNDNCSLTIKDCVNNATYLIDSSGTTIAGFTLGSDSAAPIETEKLMLEDCLMMGTIIGPEEIEKQGKISGFVNKTKGYLTMKNCVMAGTLPEYAYTFMWDNRAADATTVSDCVYVGEFVDTVNKNTGATVHFEAKTATLDDLKDFVTFSTAQQLSAFNDWVVVKEGAIMMPISAALAAKVANYITVDGGTTDGDQTGGNQTGGTTGGTTGGEQKPTETPNETPNETPEETKAPETTAAAATAAPTEEKKGCKSTVAGGIAIVAVVTGTAVAFAGKRKEQ